MPDQQNRLWAKRIVAGFTGSIGGYLFTFAWDAYWFQPRQGGVMWIALIGAIISWIVAACLVWPDIRTILGQFEEWRQSYSRPLSITPKPTKPIIAFNASIAGAGADYPDGYKFGGIKWEKLYTDVRVAILNTSGVPLVNLDLTIGLDPWVSIWEINQLTAIPDVSITDPDSGTQVMLGLKSASTGETVRLPGMALTLPPPPMRLSCPRLLSRQPLKLVIAALALNPVTKTGFPSKMVADERKPPSGIRIQGTIETGPIDGLQRHTIVWERSLG